MNQTKMTNNLLRIVFILVTLSKCASAQRNDGSDSSAQDSEKAKCICVPYYQCDDGNIITDGSGLIDARKKTQSKPVQDIPVGAQFKPPKCGDIYVCCKIPAVGSTAKPYHHNCGVRQANGINSRILSASNKSEAQFGEWPWQAMILKKGDNGLNFLCGAVLIDDNHVLTAGHCVYAFAKSTVASNIMVRLGEWDTRKTNEFLSTEDRYVVSIHIHPEYRNRSLWNDIAVLGLRDRVIFAPNVDTACLPKPKESFLGAQCVVTGWGKDAFEGGSYSNILKAVSVPMIQHDNCQNLLRKTRLGEFFHLHNSFLCAGGQKGKDSCKGDGGGPLSCYRDTDGVYVLAGLVSWGIDCGHSEVPGVYVSVVEFLEWITTVTGRPLQSYWPVKE